MTESVTNAPELSVSELSGALKRTIEDAFGRVRLRGEISGYRGPHSSGHVYFSLKDAGARIDAVIWKGSFARLRFKPEEGMEVVATGKVTTFPGKSAYQIVIDQLEPAGVGALMALLDERRRKLQAEGLFDPARKQLLPYLPGVIGVVTSPTGAVIRDILHRLSDRFPRRVLVWPVRVQGETSAAEVAAAIAGFNALAPGGIVPRPDVLIVARGGGSLEDLWGFNEEIVVRAAAASDIPLIAAVGHETDTTLIDFAADVRAPTPTAAAEMAVPVRADLLALVRDHGARMTGAALRRIERDRAAWRSAARALPGGDALLSTRRQRLDIAAIRAGALVRSGLERRRQAFALAAWLLQAQAPRTRLARFAERLAGLGARMDAAGAARADRAAERLAMLGTRLSPALQARLGRARDRLAGLSERLRRATLADVERQKREQARRRERIADAHRRLRQAAVAAAERRHRRIESLGALLDALGYRQVLARGFALVRDSAGQPVRRAAGVADGAALEIEFSDGRVQAVAGEGAPRPPRHALRPPRAGGGQGSLF